MKLLKLALVLITVFLWGQWIIHLAEDHVVTVWHQVIVLGIGVLIPVLVVARDWRKL